MTILLIRNTTLLLVQGWMAPLLSPCPNPGHMTFFFAICAVNNYYKSGPSYLSNDKNVLKSAQMDPRHPLNPY